MLQIKIISARVLYMQKWSRVPAMKGTNTVKLLILTFHLDGGTRSLYAKKQRRLLNTQMAPPGPLALFPKNIISLSGYRMIWLDSKSTAPPFVPELFMNNNCPWTFITQFWNAAAPVPPPLLRSKTFLPLNFTLTNSLVKELVCGKRDIWSTMVQLITLGLHPSFYFSSLSFFSFKYT